MNFLKFILALLLPPVYFLVQKRYVLGTIYLLIFLFLGIPLTILFGFGLVIWLFMAIHALFDLGKNVRKKDMDYQARKIAEEIRAVK